MLLPHNSTVAVSDGRELRLFRNAGTELAPRLEAEPAPQLVPADGGSGGRHHSSAANPDAQQLREDSHASTVARWLNGEALGGRIEHLAVVAPPRTLGEMRRHFHPELRKRLVVEIGREMTSASPAEIERALIKAA